MRTELHAIVILGLLLAVVTLPADAETAQTYEYTAATNVRTPVIALDPITICPDECTIGGFLFDHPQSDAAVVPDDVVWGENVGALYCIRPAPSGPWCSMQEELDVVPDREYSHGPVCGPTVVPLEPHPFDPIAIAFVYTILVQDDLTLCGAAKGTMTITH